MSLAKHIKIAKRNSKITPRIHNYLNNNPDGIKIESEEVAKKVLEILAPAEHDRSGHFHPSQLYECQRKQIFDFYNVKGDTIQKSYNPTLQNLFNDGHFRHLRWQIMLMNAGVLTDVEVKVSIPEKRLGGSADGINSEEGWIFELKGTSQFKQVSQRGAMPAHIKQVHAYMLASGYNSALIVYECKSSQEWVEIEVSRDEKIIQEIEEILTSLNHVIDTGEMPEVLHECQNKTGKFNSCPYSSKCLRVSQVSDFNKVVPPKRRVANTKRVARRN